MHRFLQTTQERVPFFFRQTVSFVHQHLRQGAGSGNNYPAASGRGLLGRLQLRVIRLEQRQVHGSTLTRFLRLDPDRAFHLAAFDKTVQLGAQLEFLSRYCAGRRRVRSKNLLFTDLISTVMVLEGRLTAAVPKPVMERIMGGV